MSKIAVPVPSFRSAVLALCCLGGCLGQSLQARVRNTVSIALTPTSTSVLTGATVAFKATVQGSSNTAVAWYVDGVPQGNASTGTIPLQSTSVTYYAPATAGSHTVKAVSSANTQKTASATVTVTAPVPVAVAISPASASLNTLGSITLSASVSGSSNTAVTWSVDGIAGGNSTVGTLACAGTTATYTAPAGAGSHAVTATSAADTSKKAASSVAVLAPAVVVALTPTAATVTTGASTALTASVSGTSSTGVTWTVDGVAGGNTTVGTLAGTGNAVTYTAPAAAGSHTVKATSIADATKSATSAITVQSASNVVVALAQTGGGTINVSGSVLFTATVTGTTNTAVTWSVDGVAGGNASVGTLKGSGPRIIYTAPAATGSHVVTATSAADPSRSASAALTVAASSIVVANPALVLNVRNAPYNAKGDGVSDDTNAIQAAINAAAGTGGTVQIPDGTYMINLTALNGEMGLMTGTNMTLSLSAGATLKAKPSSLSTSYVIYVSGGSHINIKGGTIVGDRLSHTGTSGEWGMGIGIGGTSSNVTIEGVTITQCWGDGIYVTDTPSNLTVANVICDGNRRQGMSIVDVNGMVVRDSIFRNTSGASPENGIDIEPNAGQTVNKVQIFNCSFSNNNGGGIQSGPSVADINVAFFSNSIFMGNTCSGNAGYGISVSAAPGNTVTDNVVGNTAGYGILARNGAANTMVTNNTVTGSSLDGFWLNQCTGTLVTGNTATGNTGHGIENISGSGATVTGNTISGNGINP